VAAAIKAGLEGLDIPFVPTVASAVVTLTAKAKGVNDTAVTAATTDSTQTLTVAQTQAGSDVVANPGWFARSTIDAPGIVLVDMN
jgi:phage tail sheath gpL-like